MKKFLIVLTVLALVASSAFAAVTTVTKEDSQASYPGVLTKGSVTGTSTFIADLPLLANTALFEYAGGVYGLVAMKTGFGVIGLSVSPSISPNVTSFPGNNMDTVGLQYATELEGMTLGAALILGNAGYGYENKDLVVNTAGCSFYPGYDKVNTSDSYTALKLGAALKGGLDLALGVEMDNTFKNLKGYDNVLNGKLRTDVTNDQSILGFNLSGRMDLGNGLLAVLGGTYNMGTDKDTTLTYDVAGTKTGDTTVTETNGRLQVAARIGKDIKATDTLTVKIASGANFVSDSSEKTITKAKLPTEVTTYATGDRWSEVHIRVPLNVAVEGRLNDMWSINAGTSATLISTRNNSTKTNILNTVDDPKAIFNENTLNITPSLNYAIGVTGKIGDLTLDLMMNPALLLTGPNFISGTTIGLMNYAVALVYNWK